jgi:hypothetical protein
MFVANSPLKLRSYRNQALAQACAVCSSHPRVYLTVLSPSDSSVQGQVLAITNEALCLGTAGVRLRRLSSTKL